MLKNNKKGFTLIEIIVVVVILAVLMAVAVPSLLKYLDTAQEAPALTETHAIVTAAQKRVIEKYSQTKDENISLNATDNKWIEDFVGEDGKILDAITVTNKEVTRLYYQASNGLYVLYENQEYKIIDKNAERNTVIGILTEASELASNDVVQKYLNTVPPNYNAASKELLKLYKEQNGGQFKNLSDKERQFLSDKGYNGTCLWKPAYTADGKIVLLADSRSSEEINNTMSTMIYYEGKYYYHTNGYNDKVDTSFIDLGKLTFNSEGIPISNDNKGKWFLADLS
jgi:prepilin-type N-terminal cleavage/methylation domain-containing protein